MSKWVKWKRIPKEERKSILTNNIRMQEHEVLADQSEPTKRRLKTPRASKAPMVRRSSFAIRLRELRLGQGLGQAELGRRAGVSGPSINTLERGINAPKVETREKLERYFGQALPDVSYRHNPRGAGRIGRPASKRAASLKKARQALAAKRSGASLGMDTSRKPADRNLNQDLMALMFQYGTKEVAALAGLIATSLAGETIETVRTAVQGKGHPHEDRR